MLPRLLPLVLATAVLTAQAKLDPRPAGAVLSLEFDGPAGWSHRFAGTRIADLLRSKHFAELVAPVQQWLDEQTEAAKKSAPVDVEAVREGVLAYAGRVRVVVCLESGQDDAGDPEVRVSGYVSAGPDGHTDLGAVCKELERLALDAKHEVAPVTMAGEEWLASRSGEVRGTLPRMFDDHAVVLFYAAGHEARVDRLFTEHPAAAEAETPPPLRVQVDCKAALDLALAQADSDADVDLARELLRRFLGEVGRLTASLGAAGEFLDASWDLELPGPRGSIVAMVFPERESPPRLLDLVPRQHEAFAVGALDLGKLEPIVKDFLEVVPDAPTDWQGLEASVEEHAGVRLGPDLLQHLGTEFVLLGGHPSAGEPVDELTATMGIDGTCLGVGLRDGAALARSLETILDKTGVGRMRKTEKYRDVDVHRLTLPLVNQKLHWAVTDRLLVLAIGDQGRANLQALLDGAVARDAAPAAFPKELTERLALADPKFTGISFQATKDTLGTIQQALTLAGNQAAALGLEGEEDEPPARPPFDPTAVLTVLDGVKKLLQAHRLEHVLTLTYCSKDRVRQRMLW